jgi:hypothetical protein
MMPRIQIATVEAMYTEQVKAAPIEPWVPKIKVRRMRCASAHSLTLCCVHVIVHLLTRVIRTQTVVTDESLSKEAALKKEQESNANPDDFEAQVWCARV